MTDGVLLNRLRDDPELNGVDIIVFDEFHERSVGSDTALALCRQVQTEFRPDLQLVVMSATLLGGLQQEQSDDNESAGTKLLRVLGGPDNCKVLKSQGRQYPIAYQHFASRQVSYHSLFLRDTKLLVSTVADAVEEGLLRAPNQGDVLAFLPGAREIRRVVEELRSRSSLTKQGIDIVPLYGALPKAEQDRAINKFASSRRVVVSSPIAEASLTIPGITCVVDSGLQREPQHDVSTGLPRLVTVACSKDSAVQRAGRAGRNEDGYCIRLFSDSEYEKLPKHTMPEIGSTDLVPIVLLLSEWGCNSVSDILKDIPFVDAPPLDSLQQACNMLVDLGALETYRPVNKRREQRFRMTPHGKCVVRLATHPRFATCIIRANHDKSNLVAAVVAAAVMDDETAFRAVPDDTDLAGRVKFAIQGGRSTFAGRQVLQYASRISDEARAFVLEAMSGNIPMQEVVLRLGRALLPGFIDLVAKWKGNASYGGSTYMLSLGRSARLDDKRDGGDYIIVVNTSTGDDGKTHIRSYAKIDHEALIQVAVEKEEFYTVPSEGYEVRSRKVVKVGALQLSSFPLPSPSSEQVVETLLETIAEFGGVYSAMIQTQPKNQVPKTTELRRRLRLAQSMNGDFADEEDWPPCFAALDAFEEGQGTDEDDEILIALVEPWLGVAGSLKAVCFEDILLFSLSPSQLDYLDRYFPTSLQAPDGTAIHMSYSLCDSRPVASAKLQQFFGETKSPSVGPPEQSIPVSISLLSPGGKLLAQTIDLPFFWKETYPQVRSEMRGRYPKHPWPEDPMSAVPTRMSKKEQQMNRQCQKGVDSKVKGGKSRRKSRARKKR